MKRLAIVVALSSLPFTALGQAPAKGPNGGIVTSVDGHDVEMVVTGTELVIYLFDDDRKPAGGRAGARAVVQDKGKTTTVPLSPLSPNRLVGMLAAPLAQGARVVVSATLEEGHKIQARFENK